MAKGDHKRMQDEISRSYDNTVQGYGYKPAVMGSSGNVRSPGTPGVGGSQDLTKRLYANDDMFLNNYKSGVGKSLQSYDDIMNAYKGFGDRNSEARSTYSNLAQGGGVDVDSIRHRAAQGTRAVYANAKRNLDRNRSMQGGYSPGYATALTRMAREQGQGVADSSMNAEASVADLISRNKIAGAGGLANLEGMDLSNINSMSSLYGQTPGLANMFGNQLNNSNNNLLQNQGLMNQIAQMMMQGRAQNAQIPGNFQQAMGNINSIVGLGSRIVGGMSGLGGPGNYIRDSVRNTNDSIYG